MKQLSKEQLTDLKEKNQARQLIGLPLLKVKVRKCLNCGQQFESAEYYLCGCQNIEEDIAI